MTTATITIKGHNGDEIEAYHAAPALPGRVPGVVVIHHMPGWDEWTTEVVRKLAHHGYAAIAPHLNSRLGPGSPDDLAAKVRSEGGMIDSFVMGDVEGSMKYLRAQPNASGKIGVIGFCSGGRHTYLAACTIAGIDAAVDCWGGGVIVDDRSQITERRPVAPIDLTEKMTAPLLGIFGNDDQAPTPDQVNRTEAELKRLGKSYEFHRYDGAGHGFFGHYRPGYRQEQAVDGWEKVLAFYERYLKVPVAAAAARS
jgi:carboxymethylenebutenolidase